MNITNIRRFIEAQRLYFWMVVLVVLTTSLNLVAYSFISAKPKRPIEQKEVVGDGSLFDQRELQQKVEETLKSNSMLGILLLSFSFLSFLLFTGGIVIGIMLIYQKIQGRPLVPFALPHTFGSWQIWDMLKVAVMVIFFNYIISNIEFFLFTKKQSASLLLLNSWLNELLVIGLLIYVAVVEARRTFQDLGLKITHFFKNILAGIVSYIVFFPVFIVIVLMVVFLAGLFKIQPLPHPIMETLVKEESSLTLFFTIFLAVFIAPFIEEVFFRGFMYKILRSHFGIGKGIFFTSFIFAFLHANITAFLPIFALAIVLTYLYEKTGSLVSSITLHSLHNAAIVIVLLLGKSLLSAM